MRRWICKLEANLGRLSQGSRLAHCGSLNCTLFETRFPPGALYSYLRRAGFAGAGAGCSTWSKNELSQGQGSCIIHLFPSFPPTILHPTRALLPACLAARRTPHLAPSSVSHANLTGTSMPSPTLLLHVTASLPLTLQPWNCDFRCP